MALDICAKEKHDADHMAGSVPVSRAKLEMKIEGVLPILNSFTLYYYDACNRGAFSVNAFLRIGCVNAFYIDGGLNDYWALFFEVAPRPRLELGTYGSFISTTCRQLVK